MRPARLAEPSNQRGIRSLEKPKLRLDPAVFFQLGINSRKLSKRFAFTHIDDERSFRVFFFGFYKELVEFREETDREIIDAEITAIFKGAEEGALTGTAESRNDDE